MPGWWHILYSLRFDIVAEIVVLNLRSLKSESSRRPRRVESVKVCRRNAVQDACSNLADGLAACSRSNRATVVRYPLYCLRFLSG